MWLGVLSTYANCNSRGHEEGGRERDLVRESGNNYIAVEGHLCPKAY